MLQYSDVFSPIFQCVLSIRVDCSISYWQLCKFFSQFSSHSGLMLFKLKMFRHCGFKVPCSFNSAPSRFFLCLETLIGCGLSGPASPLAFSESVLGVMSRNAAAISNKEHLWRMWSLVVNPLTDTITQVSRSVPDSRLKVSLLVNLLYS